MTRVCSYCKKIMGYKPGEGVTHGVCSKCLPTVRENWEKEMEAFKKEVEKTNKMLNSS